MTNIFYDWHSYNKIIFIAINHYVNQYPVVMQGLNYISTLFNFSSVFVFMIGLAFTSYVYIKNIATEKRKIYNLMFYLGLYYGLVALSCTILKFSINIPRPFCSLDIDEFTTIANVAHERCLSGFPSAHTALSFMFITFLWQNTNAPQKLAMITIFCIIIISRISLAMHYPADIIYSILLVVVIKCIMRYAHQAKKDYINKISEAIYQLFFENNTETDS